MPKIKICCISSAAEARLAIQHGTDALGFVGPMPSGPGVVSNSLIHDIVAKVPPPISTFLLTSETTFTGILEHYRKVRTSVIQLVDAVQFEEYDKIKIALPHVKLVQVIHVEDAAALGEAIAVSKHVDALLLDSGKPKQGIFGGTGQVHNWNISRNIVENVECPVFLAGGLNDTNIVDAIDIVKPFGVDICSGVRTDQKLDEVKLKSFMSKIREANLLA